MDVLWYVRKASLWRTVVWSLRTRRQPSRLVVCPDVHIGLSRNAQLTGDGTLHLGRRWDLGRFRQSELNLMGDAVLEVKGYVKIFTGFGISVNPGARLTLGSGFINTGARIDCFEEISIGDHVAIAPGVVIRDSDNHQMRDEAPVSAPIRIGNHVWIGLNAVILKGVTVNDGAVVAAGAVVTRDVPARALVGGVPARIIRENVEWR